MNAGVVGDIVGVLVESSPVAMIATNGEGSICFVNAETERMLGYPRGELIGQSVDILLPTSLRQRHATLRQIFTANPAARPMGVGRELIAVRRDGREIPVEIGLKPIQTGTGLIVLATLVDITTRRKIEELAQKAAALECANEKLAQFALIAAHDLQEPLQKMAAFSELLGAAIAGSKLDDALHASGVIRASAQRARELVGDLLTYSCTVHEQQKLQDLDLREEIEHALGELSQAAAETKAEITLDAPSVKFKADKSQFARLMQNILSNAIKYRKPGEPPQISIAAVSAENSHIRLAIADKGIGFDEEFARMIFEPFSRLHTGAQYPGTGIGLAICKSVADRHGWEISVKARPNEGATFILKIPKLDDSQ